MKFFYLTAVILMGVSSAFSQGDHMNPIEFSQHNEISTDYFVVSQVKSGHSFSYIQDCSHRDRQRFLPRIFNNGNAYVSNTNHEVFSDSTAGNFKFQNAGPFSQNTQKGSKFTSNGEKKGALIILGVGIGIEGVALIPYYKSKNLYRTYKTRLNPNAPDYNNLSRQDHYDKANSQYLTAQILAAAGGLLILTSVIKWVIFKKERKKLNQNQSYWIEPAGMDISTARTLSGCADPIGVKLNFNLSK